MEKISNKEFNMKDNHILYRHLKPNGEVFYIGIGNMKRRAYNKALRHNDWKDVVKEFPNYEVQILKSDLTKEDAEELETILIDFYGRKDKGEGTLVNKEDGSDYKIRFKKIKENLIKEYIPIVKRHGSGKKIKHIPSNVEMKSHADMARYFGVSTSTFQMILDYNGDEFEEIGV